MKKRVVEVNVRAVGRGTRRMQVSVESVIVVLTGRKKRWPRVGKYQTSPQGKRFTGVKFRIEAVYQRTVMELERKGSVFWLAFVPLARDADEAKLRRTVEALRTRANEEEFVEVVATMLSMAQLKKDRPEFVNVIRSAAVKEDTVRHPWYVEGQQDGREEGLEKGLSPLVYLFERRLGRPLRDSERKRIALRLTKEGPEKLGSVVLDLSREDLISWLAPRKTKTSKAA